MPEANHGFFVLKVTDIETDSIVYNTIQITWPHIYDLNDLSTFKAKVVNNGTGIFIQMPSVPHFMLYAFNEMIASEQEVCERTAQRHKINAYTIRKDETRHLRTVYMRMPPDVTVTCELPHYVSRDGKRDVFKQIRTFKKTDTFGSSGSIEQSFWPLYWRVRIESVEEQVIKEEGGNVEEICAQFKGIKF